MLVTATDQLIDRTLGTNIGDMTSSGGLAAAFDGVTAQAATSGATKLSNTFGYVGKTLATASVISKAVVYGSNNAGYVNSINPTVTIDLYGKTGSAPANSTNGTLLGTISFTDTADESGTPRQVDSSSSAVWDHAWIRVSHNGAANNIHVAELLLFEDWEPELEDGASENNPLFGYDNVVISDNITASSEETDFPATNLANVSTALKWAATSAAIQTVTVDVSGLGEIDYVGLAKHNLDLAGSSVALLGAVGTLGFTITATGIPSDDVPIIFRFAPQELDQIILVFTAGSLPVEAAILYAGQLIQMQQGIQSDYVPLPRANMLDVVNGRSESGNFLGRIITGSKLASSASFANLDEDWFLENIYPIVLEGFQEPFFWAWRPIDQPDETAFAWMVNDPQASRDLEGTIAFDFDMVGIA